ncbi:MAG: hypothetical protein SPH62_05925, partial [Candidatus Egerieousia sp.]|nr:hypothetical protein [Candidatus Egerieousia sp.]
YCLIGHILESYKTVTFGMNTFFHCLSVYYVIFYQKVRKGNHLSAFCKIFFEFISGGALSAGYLCKQPRSPPATGPTLYNQATCATSHRRQGRGAILCCRQFLQGA